MRRETSVAHNGKMSPLSCLKRPKFVPGEGSVFFSRISRFEKEKIRALLQKSILQAIHMVGRMLIFPLLVQTLWVEAKKCTRTY
jgi:hypothetical protein